MGYEPARCRLNQRDEIKIRDLAYRYHILSHDLSDSEHELAGIIQNIHAIFESEGFGDDEAIGAMIDDAIEEARIVYCDDMIAEEESDYD